MMCRTSLERAPFCAGGSPFEAQDDVHAAATMHCLLAWSMGFGSLVHLGQQRRKRDESPHRRKIFVADITCTSSIPLPLVGSCASDAEEENIQESGLL
jgi:hypothetical protein